MTTTPLRGLDVPVEGGCRVLARRDPGNDPAGTDAAAIDAAAFGRLLDLVTAASDRSSGSPELTPPAGDWPATYALSPARPNAIRALDLAHDATVLEIGAGCGPVTRYLGEQCAVVDALEADPARAAVAHARAGDLPSVEVFVGTLRDVPPVPAYDVVVAIDVFEHVGGGTADPEPYLAFLRACAAVLRPGGTLVLPIANALGVKYLSGAAEEHTGRPFDSLEGYLVDSPVRTFPRRTVEEMLASAGFGTEVLAAFPDHRLPRVVMSDSLFRSSGQLAQALPRFPSPDHTTPRLQLADEALTWRNLVAAGVGEHFANSFVVLGVKGDGPSLWAPERHAVMFNTGRQPQFCVRSEIRGAGADMHVARTPLYPERAGGGESTGPLRHTLAERELVVRGEDLLQVVLDEPERRSELLRRWAALVPVDEWAPVDLVPHNVVLTPDDTLVAIDQEWSLRGYDRDALLVRGLFQSAVQMASRTRPERLRPHETVGALLHALAADTGIDLDDDVLDRFVVQEAAFQALVNVTDATPAERRARSGEEIRAMLTLPLTEVRGGDRFDVQWQRAVVAVDELHAAFAEQQRTHDEALAACQRALDAVREEAAELRARQPVAVARRITGGVLRRVGLRRPR
jgi:SAM-dependent methyltransferase